MNAKERQCHLNAPTFIQLGGLARSLQSATRLNTNGSFSSSRPPSTLFAMAFNARGVVMCRNLSSESCNVANSSARLKDFHTGVCWRADMRMAEKRNNMPTRAKFAGSANQAQRTL